ncbi:MAG: chorismate synthase [Candidatus Omnitrophota bacterium]|nr:chorismate synthase [Candidatus Omnitrophota bacterium]
MLRYLTGGESHGKCMLTIVDGIPAGLHVDKSIIDLELARRMLGYGRGKRMAIESDKVDILSGLRKGCTVGSPVSLLVNNADHSIDKLPKVYEPRPGHADLSGILKYNLSDIRDVLERASARETVSRVAVGALCKILLAEFGITVVSHVIAIGPVVSKAKNLTFERIAVSSMKSPVMCADLGASAKMCKEIDKAISAGDSLGGVFEIMIHGVPPGLGSYAQWDRRIDGSLARAIMSIQAIKGVDFGSGFTSAALKGSLVHDEIFYDKKKGFYRKSNNAGGIEGGMTTGEDIVIRAAMKPISTLKRPLSSVDIRTKRPVKASVERSDVCAVPAAAVIGEAVSSIEIANSLIEKFGGDSVSEMRRNYDGYLSQVKRF